MKIISAIAYVAAISILGYATFNIAFYDGIQGGSDYLILAAFFAMISQFAVGVWQGMQAQKLLNEANAAQDELAVYYAELNKQAEELNSTKDKDIH